MISDHNLSMYAGNQNTFNLRSEEAICKGLALITEARKCDADLSQLFFSCLDTFARIRHEIAIHDNSKDKYNFGRWRMDSIESLNYTPPFGVTIT